nr:MAG TPA: hypothetical protein [Caudoviricetes sp.]
MFTTIIYGVIHTYIDDSGNFLIGNMCWYIISDWSILYK